MREYIDTDELVLSASPTLILPATLNFQYGTGALLEFQFVSGGQASLLPAGTTVQCGIKLLAAPNWEGNFLTSTTGFSTPGTSAGYYTAILPIVGAAIKTALQIGNDPANDLATVQCEGQVAWTPPGSAYPLLTQNFPVNLNNSVIQGTEANPSTSFSASSFAYMPSITALTGGSPTTLDSVATVGLPAGYLAMLLIGGSLSQWALLAGAAGAGDVAPLDYNAGTNAVHWQKVGGL
jgi:hypothetical protein